ncbi:hypothetical protein [Streptomyces sp. H27-C3]|uniref:hypothetical protein n=1 Tax=Streptomyces sp. H27-C3 TaxID=3046305 RepID=UPI0024BA6262|nr:hypothetical protein [Streptomyces sp. H27-C3]MDJ0460636.1 hypothetical protein [Streptomyces sp. H27-C3]
MTQRHLTAALFIDCGDAYEIRDGDRAGRIVRKTQPRARYECLLCRTREGPVTGADRVREFVARIRTDHPTYCTANQGAHAA